MRTLMVGLVAAAWCGTAAVPRPAAALQQREEWTWNGSLAPGKTLEVRGINGSIFAEPSSSARVEVTAVKRARRSDPGEVRIEVVEHGGGVTICAVYPSTRRGRPNTCEPGGGRSNTDDNDVEVDFTVRVPRGVGFAGHNVNGGVEAAGLDGPVALQTVNGAVRLETSAGDAEATTVNGSVTATVRAVGQRSLRFHTVNGGITLSLPSDISADLEARTVNGSIDTDFPIQVVGRMNPRWLSGRIGQGGRSLDLETVNGSIRLRRLP